VEVEIFERMAPRRRLEFHPSADVDAEVIECEAAAFDHYYGNTAAELAEAYGPYLSQTAFLVVRAGDDVVGTCRLIRPGPLGLKTVADLGEAPWRVDTARSVTAAGIDLAHTWDVATIAVRRRMGAAGRMVASALFHGLARVSEVNKVESMTAVLDRRARALMAMQGLEVHALPGTGPAPYLGSVASTPVFAHLAPLLARQRRVSPEHHRMLTVGWGLDVALPPREQYRVPVGDASSSVPARSPRTLEIDLRERDNVHPA
jgi:hypothetical protein